MTKLKSAINPRSDAFKENQAAMRALMADLRAKVTRVKEGGGAAAPVLH